MLDRETVAFIIDLNEIDDGDCTTISMDFTVNYGPMVLAPTLRPRTRDKVRVHSPDEDTLYWAVVEEELSERDLRVRILWETCAPVLNRDWFVATVASYYTPQAEPVTGGATLA